MEKRIFLSKTHNLVSDLGQDATPTFVPPLLTWPTLNTMAPDAPTTYMIKSQFGPEM